MQVSYQRIENPNGEYWIWEKKIHCKTESKLYPSTISNVGSGVSVAVYQKDENCNEVQIAQLQLPDYDKLAEYYTNGKDINLDYSYVDNFAWLGEKRFCEAKDLPVIMHEGFSARCSLFNGSENKVQLNLMNSTIKSGDIDFDYSGFINLDINLFEVDIEQGNLLFRNTRLYDTDIYMFNVRCGGNRANSSELSFCYAIANDVTIETMLFDQDLSIDFLGTKTCNTTISIDTYPAVIKELCLIKSTVNTVNITNSYIDILDIRESNIDSLKFHKCRLIDCAEINGCIQELYIFDCLISAVFKLSVPHVNKLSFSGTINNGKIKFSDFVSAIPAMVEKSCGDAEQLLMLKENFRQNGEYENEDICHLHFQKLKTKEEKNALKKTWRCLIDCVSGYGTKPFRMLVVILAIIILFGTLYYFIPYLSYHGANTWIEHIYVSGITFFAVGYGDLYPLNTATKMVSLLEAFLGVVSTSYFLVLLSRKVIR
ncbi:MAG: potassium channel family protein [Erysipelotrichaceae bacterium]|nr:potassium channel family protein [Erysipelotrichaceae bacterium]